MPLAVVAAAANVNDMCVVGPTLDALADAPIKRPRPTRQTPQGLCMDKGYDFAIVRELAQCFRFVAHIRSRGEEAHARRRGRKFKARRWVVERCHSWMNRFRRLLVRWEKYEENYLAMLHLACGIIAFRQSGLLG